MINSKKKLRNYLNEDSLFYKKVSCGYFKCIKIKLYGGVSGSADAAVEALLAGNLDYNPAVKCNHHGEHGEGHTCGEHGCGGHH